MTIVGTITENRKVTEISFENRFGAIVEIGNIPMKLAMYWRSENNISYLGVYANCCDRPDSNLWSFNARLRFHLMRGNEQELTMTGSPCYKVGGESWGCNQLVTKEELIDPANGYVTNGAFRIVLDIEISDVVGFHKKGVTDFSIPQNIETEVALCFGEQKLYADKCALMCFSSVFHEMLTSKDSKEIEIKDSNYQSVATFLRALNQGQQITDTNIETILTIANRYDFSCLISNCEDFLISSKSISIVEKVRLAELFQLSGLQTQIVENVTTDELGKVVQLKAKMGAFTAKWLLMKMCDVGKVKEEKKDKEEPRRSKDRISIFQCLAILVLAYILCRIFMYFSN